MSEKMVPSQISVGTLRGKKKEDGKSQIKWFSALQANLADSVLMALFLYFPENRSWYSSQIISEDDASRKHAYIILTPLNPTFI